jgi:hypothetical protein
MHTDIHALSGIRTLDPIVRTSVRALERVATVISYCIISNHKKPLPRE